MAAITISACLMSQFRVLHGRGRGRVPLLRILHVVIHEDARRVRGVVKCRVIEYAALSR
jgi:hypothetical protein